MKKAKRIIVAVTLLIAAAFFMNSNKLPAGNVQAASAASMKKAYKRYLANNVSGKKYFKVVNIGDRNKPVLLIGTYKGYGKGSYTGCKVCYYKGGKVRKVGSLSAGRGIDLYTKKGQNYWGCCPFHNEKTPSFSVNEDKGFYHCFGCGEHGDIISFTMKSENVGFVDAIKELADMAGMKLPEF